MRSLWAHVLSLLGIIAIIYHPSAYAQDQPPQPGSFQNFDVALQHSHDNLCPYLTVDNQRLPLVCWVCRFPYGLQKDKRYTYDCCPGYERSKIDGNKCIQVERNYKTILGYLEEKGKDKTVHALKSNTGLGDLMEDPSLKVYTVFVPQNDDDVQSGEFDYTGRDNAARMMIALGRHYSKEFKNRKTIRNENDVDMKMTTYSNGLTFLECRLVWSPDHETTNGVVHFLDGAIPPTHQYPTVLARLQANPDVSEFVQSFPQDLKNQLSKADSNEWYTVFAPTNSAWSEAKRSLGSRESIEKLARHHVLDRMICGRSVIDGSDKVGPMEDGGYIKLSRSSDGSLVVSDACNTQIPLIRKDLMSGTGVVHIIDNTITSLRTMNMQDALKCLEKHPSMGVSTAVRDINECATSTESKATVVLLPNEEAFNWMRSSVYEKEFNRMRSDRGYKCSVYAHQMLTPSNPRMTNPKNRGFIQGQQFSTDYKSQNGAGATVISSYIQDPNGSKLKFGSATAVDKEPLEFRDGVIYIVNTVNTPPEKSIMDIIRSEPDLKIIADKLTETGMHQKLNAMKGNVLFLAPIDSGWKTRDLENAYDTKQNEKLIQLHTIPNALLGGEIGSIGYATWQTTDSLLSEKANGQVKLIIKRNPDGNTFIGHSELPEEHWAMVLRWNKIGTDGVVWIIDWPIKCPPFTC